MKKNQPNYYCLHCPHSGLMHGGGRCGGLDAAGDTCDCDQFVPDTHRAPMEPYKAPPKITKKQKNWVVATIESEGLDYTFRYYSTFEEIKDPKFRSLVEAYVKASKELTDFLGID